MQLGPPCEFQDWLWVVGKSLSYSYAPQPLQYVSKTREKLELFRKGRDEGRIKASDQQRIKIRMSND